MTHSADTDFVISPAPLVSLPVTGQSARFPVGRLFCVGRNYAAHAAEMGHDVTKETPLFFMKPASAVAQPGTDFVHPTHSQEVHFEIEMVVAMATGGADIAAKDALSHVFGYGVGLDMTLRDIQSTAKKKGFPWEPSKAFDGSAPISAIRPAADIGHPDTGAVSLQVNGALRQSGDLNQMIWPVPALIARLSQVFALQPGDLIMTGTPAGVGALARGDQIHGEVAGVGAIDLAVI